jgi:ubiquinone biosynthesis protein
MAIFNKDYRRIAELHVEAGWMPATVRIDELEAAARAICEPYFTRPLSEISLAEVLVKLFRTAQKYGLTLQPQLILLQKTLLNIEGVGRQLDPQLDIWAVAKPVLEKILLRRYSPRNVLRELRKRLPEIATRTPEMPRLVHAWLKQQVEGKHEMEIRAQELADMAQSLHNLQRRTVFAILGAALLIVAAVLYGLDAGGPRLLAVPMSAWVAALGGVWALFAAWPRK